MKTKFVRIDVCRKCEGITQKVVQEYEDCNYETDKVCNSLDILLAIRRGQVGFHWTNNCPDCVDSIEVMQ